VCEELAKHKEKPIIDSHNGKASSSEKFPFHNWYYFVLGYTPEFPEYIVKKESITKGHFVVDPFMGAGTTLVTCKLLEIESSGIDANDYFYGAVQTKLNWKVSQKSIKKTISLLLKSISNEFSKLTIESNSNQQDAFEGFGEINIEDYANEHRPEMLTERYLSNIPFVKLHIIQREIEKLELSEDIKSFFDLALSTIIVPSSNVRYGPGFGVGKIKVDVDVYNLFSEKVKRMLRDLASLTPTQKKVKSQVKLGDSRKLSSYYGKNTVDFMITSPPYPGDHEYTKHTRLELIFSGIAENQEEFREIKKRMIRGSTTNIYKDDNERDLVSKFTSIQKVTSLIEERLIKDNATSGYEKLYTKLVWEYFGGMYNNFLEAKKVLREGGKYFLLVSDSHAFKMVHIQTAEILAELARDIGFKEANITLWQDKISTSHKYHLREDILELVK
jgi:DNA modification methylase